MTFTLNIYRIHCIYIIFQSLRKVYWLDLLSRSTESEAGLRREVHKYIHFQKVSQVIQVIVIHILVFKSLYPFPQVTQALCEESALMGKTSGSAGNKLSNFGECSHKKRGLS